MDDATRIRALKIYARHTRAHAIDFIDYVVDKFPFRIREVRTDNGTTAQQESHISVGRKLVKTRDFRQGWPAHPRSGSA